MTRHIFILIIILLSVTAFYGQLEHPKVIPPTPETASFTKYTDIPVGLSTGTPNISVPIFELQGKNVSVPISVNYHASGIRVNEIASRVGLGWSIQTGGMISRNVRGIPDDNTEGYLNTSNTVANYYTLNATQRAIKFNEASQGYQDYESDLYYFNFLGQSGKFFFNQNGDIIVHEKSDLKITPIKSSSNKIEGWEVISASGVIFKFGIMEGTSVLAIETKTQYSHIAGQSLPNSNPGLFNHTSGWYLTQIIDPQGNKTNYTYQNPNVTIIYWNILDHKKEFGAGTTNPCSSMNETLVFSEVRYSPVYLDKIENETGKIEFEYNTSRVDLVNDKALTNVKLYDFSNKLIRHYGFEYDYFTSTDQNQHPSYGVPNQLKERLYLKKIKEVEATNTNKEYIFSYYTNHILPNRFSYSQDLWGYYNGRSNNELYPTTEINTGTNIVTIDGGDRKVYADYVNTGSLKEIIYPTGGKTEFLYESNTITGEEGFYIGTQDVTKLISGGQLSNSIGVGAAGVVYTSNFTTTSSFPYNNIVDYTITTDYSCNSSLLDCPTIKITQTNGAIVHTFNTASGSGSINLPSGNYVLMIENGIIQIDNNVHVVLRGRELLPQEENAFTGGLRVKEIRFKDSDNTLLKKQTYQYHLFNDNQKSSGLSLNPPTFLFKGIPSTNAGGGACTKNTISSNAIFPLNGQSASHVTYTNVTELFDNGNGGKIEHEFLYTSDSQPNATNVFELGSSDYPLVPSWDYSHRRGIVKSKKVYKNNGSIYKLLEESSINYGGGYSNDGNISSSNIGMGSLGTYDGAVEYKNLSERYYKTQEILKSYDDNGLNPLIQTTTYTYDNGYSGRSFPITNQTTSSDGKVVESKIYFPDDITSTSSLENDPLTTSEKLAIDRLKKGDLHRIATPIQVETTVKDVNGTELSKNVVRTNYKDWGNNIVLPEFVQTLKGTYNSSSNKLLDRLQYHSYYDDGTIKEVSLKDGTKTVYLWGYDATLPIAKIENSSYAEIEALSYFGTNFTITDGLSANQENSLRNNLPNALVTSYTYIPLVGVSTITDPRGDSINYHYDAFNRLEYITDKNDKILSKNAYNYKN